MSQIKSTQGGLINDGKQAFHDRTSIIERFSGLVLGGFIIWQLGYLAIANVMETTPVVVRRWPETHQQVTNLIDQSRSEESSLNQSISSRVMQAVYRWGDRTAQPQRWSLFAPNIANQSGFLALELRWEGVDESSWWYSENEPLDPGSYWRATGNRFHNVEQNLRITFAVAEAESDADARKRWSDEIKRKLETHCDVMMAWMRIRLNDFHDAYPDVAVPDEVTLHCRGFQIRVPDSTGRTRNEALPYTLAIARWRPSCESPPDVLPLEAFDHLENRFVQQSFALETR
ncbi:MAG: hypothetical protein AAF664_05010 [Planctomycetota bacterium]